MVCTGNTATNWKVFKEAYTDFATATELTNKDNEIQAVTLKTVMGKECRQILSSLELSNADKKKPNKILEKLEEYFAPTRNVLYERYLFYAAQQQCNETVDQFMIRLRHLAEICKFGVLHDEMLCDRLVLSCHDKGARARLFREKDCSLKKALEALQINEAQEQLKDMGGEDTPNTINAVNSGAKTLGSEDTLGSLTPPANIVEDSMKLLEHNVQRMEKTVTSVAKRIIFTQSVYEANLRQRHQGQ